MSITFTVLQIPPSRNHYVKVGARGGYKTAKALAFEKEIWAVGAQAISRAKVRFNRCRVEIRLHVLKGHRLDIDNAPKLILDGLRNAGFYADDEAVKQMEVILLETSEQPRTEITVLGEKPVREV